jgi:hypothetical protein
VVPRTPRSRTPSSSADREDILVAFFRATYADPSKASKYFKRIEHLWNEKKPAEAVISLLQKYGLAKPIPGVTITKLKTDNEAGEADWNSGADEDNEDDDDGDFADHGILPKTQRGDIVKASAVPNGSASDVPEDWAGDVDDTVVILAKITSREGGLMTYEILEVNLP